jgi:FkbM family methyltransferase
MNAQEDILAHLLNALPQLKDFHAPQCQPYGLLKKVAEVAVDDLYGKQSQASAVMGSFGQIEFPYVSMGAIQSTHLFGLDELIIFSYYWKNRNRYKITADLGANIGLHSLMMARAGFSVLAYEPDPVHFELLTENIARNSVQANCRLINKAVSTQTGALEFVRVLGNTTGSHLAGAKKNPYGALEKFKVQVDEFLPLLHEVDFLKIDVEGHENVILLSTRKSDWLKAEAIVEIGTSENAASIFDHFRRQDINLFSQKTNWKKVHVIDDMPTSYKEGSLFISTNPVMAW